jgi:hypothetical protein
MKHSPGSPYLIPGRLADVLALIQVLALDTHVHRSDEGVSGSLQGPPASAESWTAIAVGHPEFFRVALTGEHALSLIVRHVSSSTGGRELTAEYTSKLMELAVEMHDRALRRSERWQAWLPVLTALVGGGFALLAVYLGTVLRGP